MEMATKAPQMFANPNDPTDLTLTDEFREWIGNKPLEDGTLLKDATQEDICAHVEAMQREHIERRYGPNVPRAQMERMMMVFRNGPHDDEEAFNRVLRKAAGN
jgi:hypothetical protein